MQATRKALDELKQTYEGQRRKNVLEMLVVAHATDFWAVEPQPNGGVRIEKLDAGDVDPRRWHDRPSSWVPSPDAWGHEDDWRLWPNDKWVAVRTRIILAGPFGAAYWLRYDPAVDPAPVLWRRAIWASDAKHMLRSFCLGCRAIRGYIEPKEIRYDDAMAKGLLCMSLGEPIPGALWEDVASTLNLAYSTRVAAPLGDA